MVTDLKVTDFRLLGQLARANHEDHVDTIVEEIISKIPDQAIGAANLGNTSFLVFAEDPYNGDIFNDVYQKLLRIVKFESDAALDIYLEELPNHRTAIFVYFQKS